MISKTWKTGACCVVLAGLICMAFLGLWSQQQEGNGKAASANLVVAVSGTSTPAALPTRNPPVLAATLRVPEHLTPARYYDRVSPERAWILYEIAAVGITPNHGMRRGRGQYEREEVLEIYPALRHSEEAVRQDVAGQVTALLNAVLEAGHRMSELGGIDGDAAAMAKRQAMTTIHEGSKKVGELVRPYTHPNWKNPVPVGPSEELAGISIEFRTMGGHEFQEFLVNLAEIQTSSERGVALAECQRTLQGLVSRARGVQLNQDQINRLLSTPLERLVARKP
jgi:hypothetical protein